MVPLMVLAASCSENSNVPPLETRIARLEATVDAIPTAAWSSPAADPTVDPLFCERVADWRRPANDATSVEDFGELRDAATPALAVVIPPGGDQSEAALAALIEEWNRTLEALAVQVTFVEALTDSDASSDARRAEVHRMVDLNNELRSLARQIASSMEAVCGLAFDE